MRNNKKSDNRKALPKFLGGILISALIGGILGGVAGFTGATHLPNQILAYIHAFLQAFTPWSILILSVLFLGVGLAQYRSAKKLFQSWDGENEEIIEKAEEKLSWGLLFTSLNIVTDFFFSGIGFQVLNSEHEVLDIVLLLSFTLSLAGIIVLQQKIIDLTRQINPEKQGSVYDIKFQKKWLASCDENEQRQIGQAAYKAFNAVNTTCMILWFTLVLLTYVFEIGVLPFFLVTLIFAVGQIVYTLECIRLGRHKS